MKQVVRKLTNTSADIDSSHSAKQANTSVYNSKEIPTIVQDFSGIGSLHLVFENLPDSERKTRLNKFTQVVGERVDPFPIVLNPQLIQRVEIAAMERGLAASMFLRDIYSSQSPGIYTEFPQLRPLVESSAFFAKSIVGTDMAREIAWDFQLALDWVPCRQSENSYEIDILESDSGSIGGFFQLANNYHGLCEMWEGLIDFKDFSDGTKYFQSHLKYVAERASRFGNGRPAIFVEDDRQESLNQQPASWLASILNQYGFLIIGPQNINDVSFNEDHGLYMLRGDPICAWDLRSYVEVFDSTMPEYDGLSDDLKSAKWKTHQLIGFWRNYVRSGFREWYQTNPYGTQIFIDKGVSQFLPQMVDYYLQHKPALVNSPYRQLVGPDGRIDSKLIEEITNNKDDWVIKARRESGTGIGVFIGRHLEQNTTSSICWNKVLNMVQDDPLNFIAQSFIPDLTVESPISGTRSIEFRTIVDTFDGVAVPFDQILVRSAPSGYLRTFTDQKESTVIPSLIPIR